MTEKEILPLKPQEIDLIYLIRNKYRYGTIEIMVRDGIPSDILRTIERIRLGSVDNPIDNSK
jgi:hypothetical protein